MKGSSMLLADRGRTDYVIAVARDALIQERNAADELAEHLEKISGVKFRIVAARKKGPGKRILVGPGAAAMAGLPGRALAGLGEEGLLIRTLGDDLILTGAPRDPGTPGTPGSRRGARGTLYAVSVFLEEVLGCRWWSAKASHIPRLERIEIPALNRRYVPPLEYREAIYRQSWETKWCVRNHTNGQWEMPPGGLAPEWGGYHAYEGFVHTFVGHLVPESMLAEHPEWFAQVDGKRTIEQLCMSNDGVRQFVTQRAGQLLRGNPRATIISISQNDNHVYCQCSACAATNRKEGSPAGSLLRFVNAVAQALEKEFPHVAVDTLAYLFSRRPPRHVRPRRNVIVRLCSFECDFLHPLDHANNRAFLRDLIGWSKICDRLYIWDYVTNFAHFVMPHPNWYILGDNIRLLERHGAKGIFEQGNNSSVGGELAELRAWVLAKLLWDPTRDARALIGEFLEGYYGRAGRHIDAYMRAIHAAASAVKYHPGSEAIQQCLKKRGYPPATKDLYLDLNAQPDAPFLAADLLLEALRHFQAARSAVQADAPRLARVELARLPVVYVVLLRWDELRRHAQATGQEWLLADNRLQAFRDFAEVYTANGITHLGEGWSKRNLPWLESVCQGEGKPW